MAFAHVIYPCGRQPMRYHAAAGWRTTTEFPTFVRLISRRACAAILIAFRKELNYEHHSRRPNRPKYPRPERRSS